MFNILHFSWRRRWRENPCGSSWSSHPQMLFGKQGWQWKISPSVYGLCQVGSCPLSCWNTRGYTISLLCRFHICVPVFLMFVGKAMHKSHVFPGWIRMFAAYCKSFFLFGEPIFHLADEIPDLYHHFPHSCLRNLSLSTLLQSCIFLGGDPPFMAIISYYHFFHIRYIFFNAYI